MPRINPGNMVACGFRPRNFDGESHLQLVPVPPWYTKQAQARISEAVVRLDQVAIIQPEPDFSWLSCQYSGGRIELKPTNHRQEEERKGWGGS